MHAVVWLDEISKSVPLRDMLRQSSVALTTAQCFVDAIRALIYGGYMTGSSIYGFNRNPLSTTNTERTEEGIRHAPPPDPSVFIA